MKMLVSRFETSGDAYVARSRLNAHGFRDRQIAILEGESAAVMNPEAPKSARLERGGLIGAIGLMFSGLLPDKRDEIARYACAIRGRKSVLALHVPDDAVPRAASILEDICAEIGGSAAADPTESAALASLRIFALHNSPADWRRGTKPRGALSAPSPPVGFIHDAHGLAVRGDRRKVDRRKTTRRRRRS